MALARSPLAGTRASCPSHQRRKASTCGRLRFWRASRRRSTPLADNLALDVVEPADPLQRVLGKGRGGRFPDVVEIAPKVRPASVRVSPGKGEGCSRKPFIVTQRVRHPPGRGAARQPEASLARVSATALVKRRQRSLKPCVSLEITFVSKPSVCWARGQHRKVRHWRGRPVRPGSRSMAKAREGSPGNLRGPARART